MPAEDVDAAPPSPEDPTRFVGGGSAPLDDGPDATPGDANDDHAGDDADPEASLPPGASTKDDSPD